MSSHHFVREGQEPALFILEALSFEMIQPLLEWVPTIVVADRVLEVVLQWGIKIDVVLQHSVALPQLEAMLANQFPIQISPCKSDNVLKEGMSFLIDKRCSAAVNVIAVPDQATLEDLEEFIPHLQVGVFGKTQKWSAISDVFEKWLPVPSQIFIKAHPSSALQLKGLIKNGEAWETVEPGVVRVQGRCPFWIGEWT